MAATAAATPSSSASDWPAPPLDAALDHPSPWPRPHRPGRLRPGGPPRTARAPRPADEVDRPRSAGRRCAARPPMACRQRRRRGSCRLLRDARPGGSAAGGRDGRPAPMRSRLGDVTPAATLALDDRAAGRVSIRRIAAAASASSGAPAIDPNAKRIGGRPPSINAAISLGSGSGVDRIEPGAGDARGGWPVRGDADDRRRARDEVQQRRPRPEELNRRHAGCRPGRGARPAAARSGPASGRACPTPAGSAARGPAFPAAVRWPWAAGPGRTLPSPSAGPRRGQRRAPASESCGGPPGRVPRSSSRSRA